jgi:hypothetical protein
MIHNVAPSGVDGALRLQSGAAMDIDWRCAVPTVAESCLKGAWEGAGAGIGKCVDEGSKDCLDYVKQGASEGFFAGCAEGLLEVASGKCDKAGNTGSESPDAPQGNQNSSNSASLGPQPQSDPVLEGVSAGTDDNGNNQCEETDNSQCQETDPKTPNPEGNGNDPESRRRPHGPVHLVQSGLAATGPGVIPAAGGRQAAGMWVGATGRARLYTPVTRAARGFSQGTLPR